MSPHSSTSTPLLGLAALLAFCTPVATAAEILIDCGDDDAGSPAQVDWIPLVGPTFSATDGTVTVTVTPIGAVTVDDRDRGAANGGGTEADLWRDFIFANGSSLDDTGLQVAITGLASTAFYPITLWAFDTSSAPARTAEWFADDAGGAFVSKGELGFDGNAIEPQTLGEYLLDFTVTTDAAGNITLRGLKSLPNGLDTSHNVFLTGLRIGEVIPTSAPTNLTLSQTGVASGAPNGFLVGTLTGASTLAGDTFSFQLVAGEGDVGNAFFTLSGAGQSELRVASSLVALGGQTTTIRVRVTNSQAQTLEKSLMLIVIDDSDLDNLFDAWELMFFPDLASATASGDNDADTVDNQTEYARGSNPTLTDTDGDTLSDAIETKTGIYASATNTGTDPTLADTDRDGFEDAQENPTLPSLGLQQPGTDPNKADGDGDGYGDRYELAWPSDPKSNSSRPLPEGLLIDFTNNGNQGGPQVMNGYQAYVANHEVLGEVDHTQVFPAFGTDITFTVEYPDSTTNTVRQMINRTDGSAANYIGEKVSLVRDWIGIDARAGQGGNGIDLPTTMTFTLAGLPAGRYQYRAYHHDTEFQHGPFTLAVEDAGGARDLGGFAMTASTNNATNNPSPANPGAGQGPETLSSTVTFILESDGADPVIITYRNIESSILYETFLGVNGFELTVAPVVGPILWKSVTRAPATGVVTLEWESQAGISYTVKASPDLGTGHWVTLGQVTAAGLTSSFVDTTAAGIAERYYRVERP
jgi:hypothetical protein